MKDLVADTVDALLLRAATQGEVALSIARILFCTLVAVRFVAIGAPYNDAYGMPRTVMTMSLLLAALVFSAVVLRRFGRGQSLRRWLVVSVVLDVLVCSGSLASNALMPGSRYQGILVGPDVYAMLVVVLASGIRLSVRSSWLSGGLAIALLAGIIVLDHRVCPVSPTYAEGEIAMFLILIVAVTLLASVFAWRTRSLVITGAREAVRHRRARQELERILHGHHDANSLLGALMFKVDRLLEHRLASDLREDLALLRRCIREVQDQAVSGLVATDEVEEIDLCEVVQNTLGALQPSFPALVCTARQPADAPLRVGFVGGVTGLHRVLHNLLKNAAEGDGVRGATRVRVDVTRNGEVAVLSIEDDGPGLTADPWIGTRKADGAGVGLRSTRTLVEASGGSLALESGERVGIRVRIALPLVELA